LGAAAGMTTMLPRGLGAQAATVAERAAQARADASTTPIQTTRLYDNVHLLQGAGGNMVLQTGPEGNLLIDSSFAPAVPRIREAIKALDDGASAAGGILINTHWHSDHTGGNEGLHSAGFTIFAQQNTRQRLSTPQTLKMFHVNSPASPTGGWPTMTFENALHLWRNGDSLDLVYFDPAHTDTDIYIHFHKANVLHAGDTWFHGFYPFIDEGTGGSIGGVIRAVETVLSLADNGTRIVPGHGPLGSKADLQKYHEMLSTIRDRVAALKASGATEEEAIAKKPTAEFDAAMGTGMMNPGNFTGIVYRTL